MNIEMKNQEQESECSPGLRIKRFLRAGIGKCMSFFLNKYQAKKISLIVAISYLICILYTWISAEINGYTYFSAGEPNVWIRNVEWLVGIFAIIYLTYELFKHITPNEEVIYDPYV